MTKNKLKKHTVSSLCREIGWTIGVNKPDTKFFLESCAVPIHYETLKGLGFDPKAPKRPYFIPYNAAEYIISTVLRSNLA